MPDRLTDEARVAISAVVHQNYYMPDVFAVVERIVAEQVEAAERALVERIEAVCVDLERPLAGARQRANTGDDLTAIVNQEETRKNAAARVRAALAAVRPEAAEPPVVEPADQCGDEHEFNPVVICSCTERRGHKGPHRSAWIDGVIGKPYTWLAVRPDTEGER